MAQASRYANLAVRHDRYSAKALVNMGNCLLERGEAERAKELYLEAIGVEADCVEAIYNLGLVRERRARPLIPRSPEPTPPARRVRVRAGQQAAGRAARGAAGVREAAHARTRFTRGTHALGRGQACRHGGQCSGGDRV